jgi:hypothetical protein
MARKLALFFINTLIFLGLMFLARFAGIDSYTGLVIWMTFMLASYVAICYYIAKVLNLYISGALVYGLLQFMVMTVLSYWYAISTIQG